MYVFTFLLILFRPVGLFFNFFGKDEKLHLPRWCGSIPSAMDKRIRASAIYRAMADLCVMGLQVIGSLRSIPMILKKYSFIVRSFWFKKIELVGIHPVGIPEIDAYHFHITFQIVKFFFFNFYFS